MFGYMKAYPDLEWNIAEMPSFAGGQATNIWPETPYSIPVGCRHPEEAWRVLEFIASTEGQTLAWSWVGHSARSAGVWPCLHL